MSHILKYSQIKHLTIDEFIIKLNTNSKIRVGEIKLIDLLDDYKSVTGVYVFYDEKGKPVYVGKTSSRALLERMGGHFDTRPFSFMNSLLFKLTGRKKKADSEEHDFVVVLKKAVNYGLVFAALPDKEQIGRLESILRAEMGPSLNAGRTRIPYNLNKKIKDI